VQIKQLLYPACPALTAAFLKTQVSWDVLGTAIVRVSKVVDAFVFRVK